MQSRIVSTATSPRFSTHLCLNALMLMQTLIAVLAAFFVGTATYVMARRIVYPFALEWMEGASLIQVQRILQGQSLYTRPSVDYVAMIYPPLYFYLSAAVAHVIGYGFLPLRIVSVVSTFGCFALIARITYRYSAVPSASLVAVGLFAAAYPLNGAWFDVARVDMLFLFFLLAALDALNGVSLRSSLVGGLWCAFAYLTKQTALLVVVPLLLTRFVEKQPYAWAATGSAVTLVGLSTLALEWCTDGWYSWYVFTLPGLHRTIITFDKAIMMWRDYLLPSVAIACVVIMLGLLLRVRVQRLVQRQALAEFMRFGSFIMVAWIACINPGGYLNVLLPAYAVIAIGFGVGVERLRQWIKMSSPIQQLPRAALLTAICVAQFSLLYYPIFTHIPTVVDRHVGERIVSSIREIEGEVYVPFHPELAMFAGKRPYAHVIALSELWGQWGVMADAQWPVVHAELQSLITQHEFEVIMTDEQSDWLQTDVESGYMRYSATTDTDDAFFPVTGWRIRPEGIYVPRVGQQ